MYKKNDFVNYVGNPNCFDKSRIAQIDSIQQKADYWSINLTLFNPTEKICCVTDLIRHIFTTKQNLLNLGFKEINENNKTIFINEKLIISGLYFYIPELNLLYDTGYRIGDLTEMTLQIFQKNYITNNEIDFAKFQSEFPAVAEINELIDQYSKHFDFDYNKIFQ